MNWFALLAGLLAAAPVLADEAPTFSRVKFPDSVVDLYVIELVSATSLDYDFDVRIGVLTRGYSGGVMINDRSRHIAHVRCRTPGFVKVGKRDYPVSRPAPRESRGLWSDDLWRFVCEKPVS